MTDATDMTDEELRLAGVLAERTVVADRPDLTIVTALARAVLHLRSRLAAAERERDEARGHIDTSRMRTVRERDAARDSVQAWRNWSDEVVPPWGRTDDRSDDGQRALISERMTALVRQDGALSERLARVGVERDIAMRERDEARAKLEQYKTETREAFTKELLVGAEYQRLWAEVSAKLASVERERDSYARSDFERQLDEARKDIATLTAQRDQAVAIADAIEHDIAVVTQHRKAQQSGGQHVGTGGPLAAANPSMLVYLERVVRDLRAALAVRSTKP
jgi:hypothetical protein